MNVFETGSERELEGRLHFGQNGAVVDVFAAGIWSIAGPGGRDEGAEVVENLQVVVAELGQVDGYNRLGLCGIQGFIKVVIQKFNTVEVHFLKWKQFISSN